MQGPTVELHGEFDVRSTSMVRDVIYELLAREGRVSVDMSHVVAIDMVALRVLLVATRQAAREGRTLTLRNCTPAVRRMIHLARVAHAVELERTAISA